MVALTEGSPTPHVPIHHIPPSTVVHSVHQVHQVHQVHPPPKNRILVQHPAPI